MRSYHSLVLAFLPMAIAALLAAAPARAQTPLTEAGAPIVVPNTNYPVPATNAYFVSPNGSDTGGDGSEAGPWRTLRKAVGSTGAPEGSTIVLRGGTYRTPYVQLRKRLILQPYEHETVWIKGSLVVDGWVKEGAMWRKDGWTYTFPGEKASQNIDPKFPLSTHRDMVYVNGRALRQVATRAEVAPVTSTASATFFLDDAADRLYIGGDPGGKTVEATAWGEGLGLWGGTAGTIVRGLGFAHYANQAVRVGAERIVLENNVLVWNGVGGVHIYGSGAPDHCVLRGNLFGYNGRTGLRGSAHRLLVENNTFTRNNIEHNNMGWDAAAMKLTDGDGVVVRDNRVENNDCNGIWLDNSIRNALVVHNTIRNNTGPGIYFEISHNALLAGNVLAHNSIGIGISSATSARVWNNTFVANRTNLFLKDTLRTNDDAAAIARGVTWDTTDTVIKNNLFSNATRNTEPHAMMNLFNDGAGKLPMIKALDYNAYYRTSTQLPRNLFRWKPQPKGADNRHATLAAFRVDSGFETHGLAIDNQTANPFFINEVQGDYHLKPGSVALGRGEPLPPDVAQALGWPANVPVHLGALGVYKAPPPAQPLPMPSAPLLINLAPGRPARQSSSLPGTTDTGEAGLAIDNNPDGDWNHGSVTHTHLQNQPWWQLDLGATRAIASIDIFNRTDNVRERLRDFYVFVSDQPFTAGDVQTTLSQPHVWHFHSRAQAGTPTRISVHRMGRYVRVQLAGANYLSLAEVKVMGYATPLPSLAQNKPTSQSSHLAGAPAAGAAVDNNTSGAWTSNSITHTQYQARPWWQVDLGASQNITSVHLFNRTDNSQARLANVHVFVSDQPFASGDLQATLKQPGVWHGYVAGTVGAPTSVPVHHHGRYVRIQLGDTNYLSLAEVQVLGFPNPNPNVNLALSQSADQSSTLPGASNGAQLALDNNTGGDWKQGSVTHTHSQNQPWWQLDLGASRSITHLQLFNRTDGSTERLSNLYVLVSDAPFNTSDLASTLNQAGVWHRHLPFQAGVPTSVPVHQTGRYVRVQLAGAGFLSLAEVQVLGLPLQGPGASTTLQAQAVDRMSVRGLRPASSAPAVAVEPTKTTSPNKPASSSAPSQVSAAGAVVGRGRGIGLRAEYFDNADGTALRTVRIDPHVDFDWGRGKPAGTALSSPDTWGVRWSGFIEAPVSGVYTFTTTSDDGIRVWVNGKLLIDHWTTHSKTDNQNTLALVAGQRYRLVIEYFENQKNAVCKLRWAYPGQSRQIVPTKWLHPSLTVRN